MKPFKNAMRLNSHKTKLSVLNCLRTFTRHTNCYDIKLVRKEEGKFYWKIPLGDDDATREK